MVFIDPTPAPGNVPRLMPAITASWVSDLSRQRMGAGMMIDRDAPPANEADPTRLPTPVMSEKRLAQVVSAREYDDAVEVALLVWNLPRGTRQAKVTVHAAAGEGAAANGMNASPEARVTASELLTIPAAVKRDLQMSGLPAPPQQALWAVVRVEFEPAAARPAALSLTIACQADGVIFADVAAFALPSSAAAKVKHSTSR
jgi:hypothetical protein